MDGHIHSIINYFCQSFIKIIAEQGNLETFVVP